MVDRLLARHGQVLVTLVALILSFIAAHGRSTPYNNCALLADAIVHGHVWIDFPGNVTSDALAWNGHYYVIEGVVPALLLVPLALLFGKAANQTTLAILLAAIAVSACWDVLRRLGAGVRETAWLCVFFFAGTTLWWCAMLGDVWFVEHCAAVAFTMFALRELAGTSPRGWLVAIFAAAALGSRFTLLLALPFYAWALWRGGLAPEAAQPTRQIGIARVRTLALVLAPFAAAWIWYNFARWGVWWDLGYVEFFHRDPWGQPAGSPFRLAYFPYEFYSFFLQTPALVEYRQLAVWPIFKVDVHGVALTWSTPALALAFFARAARPYLLAVWGTIALVAAPSFFYYLNGWYQYGMRHALDFEPFLVALMMLGVRKRFPIWGYVLVAYSVLVGFWGCWYWNAFVRT